MKFTLRRYIHISSIALATALAFPGISPAADSPSGALEVKVQKSRANNFGDAPVIIVPTVFVKLPVAGKVSAVKQGGANTVRAKAHYGVAGLDKALAQQLAGKVYDNFVSQLREAGYTVKTFEDIKDNEVVRSAVMEPSDATWGMPLEKDPSGSHVYVVASPSDAQNFKGGRAGGVFNQFMRLGKSKLSGGSIVIPVYTIAAPQAWAETGGGYKRISATANVAPGMNLTYAIASLLTEKGAWGSVNTREQVINIGENVGELTTVENNESAGNAFGAALSALSGAGSISRSSGRYELKVDPAAYEAALLRGTGVFNAEVARTAREALK